MLQMNSVALERALGAEAPPRSALQVLVDIEGPDSTFQQDATDYFCYAQLASQVTTNCTFSTDALTQRNTSSPLGPDTTCQRPASCYRCCA